MNKWMKILAVCSAVLLIFWDVFTFSDLTSATGGAEVFGILMRAMLPCGLLFGVTALLSMFQRSGKNILAVITAIFFGFNAVIRLFGLVVQFYEIAQKKIEATQSEILLTVEFFAYFLLAIAAIFLMIHVIKGVLRRTTLVLFGISAITLLVSWVVMIWGQVSEMMFYNTSFLEIVFSIMTADFIWSVTSLLCYTVCFGWLTKAITDSSEKV